LYYKQTLIKNYDLDSEKNWQQDILQESHVNPLGNNHKSNMLGVKNLQAFSQFFNNHLSLQFNENLNGIGFIVVYNSIYKSSKYFDQNLKLKNKFINLLPRPTKFDFDFLCF
jgi:hypothetical protein